MCSFIFPFPFFFLIISISSFTLSFAFCFKIVMFTLDYFFVLLHVASNCWFDFCPILVCECFRMKRKRSTGGSWFTGTCSVHRTRAWSCRCWWARARRCPSWRSSRWSLPASAFSPRPIEALWWHAPCSSTFVWALPLDTFHRGCTRWWEATAGRPMSSWRRSFVLGNLINQSINQWTNVQSFGVD